MGRPRKNQQSTLTDTYSPVGATQPPDVIPESMQTDQVKKSPEPHPYSEQIAKRTRDPLTGLLPNFSYTFDEFGRVDWEALIPAKYFYPRRESFDQGTDLSTIDVSTLTPDKRVLNLDGIKFLMDVRGATNISIETITSTPEHASVAVKIDWTPCIDQGMQPYSTIGICDAHAFNNVEPFKFVLASLSENKGISRATRLATRVKTYAADELRGSKDANKLDGESSASVSGGVSPQSMLISVMKQANIPFETIKNRYIEEGSRPNATEEQIARKARAEKWENETSVEPLDTFVIVTRIKERLKKKEEKKS